MGLFTAVVAGLLVSALGGSRVQIGGPTGAFIALIYQITAKHGYDGLALATIMAGLMVIFLGVTRLGAVIKFMPYPVTTGFTSGIAVIIAVSQLRDLVGITAVMPAEVAEKLSALVAHADQIRMPTLLVGGTSLLALILLRRWVPRVPGAIVVVVLGAALVSLFDVPVDTIGSRFPGGIPSSLPMPRLPEVSFALIRELSPAAAAIAFLCSIESLLSAVVADGMTGGRHKSDQELVAQGIANIASACFFGLPATGAIARTTANVKSGGKTPFAGMIHAAGVFVVMLVGAPLAAKVPIATLSAVLLVVAWNMAEFGHFRSLLRAPRSDVAVLLVTFGLTVLIDLTAAVGVGMVLASLLFMRRMIGVSNISALHSSLEGDEDPLAEMKDPNRVTARMVPDDVSVYEIDGPFFFGVADRLKDTLRAIERPPKVFVLRMRKVPAVDATGLHALRELLHKCARDGTTLILAGVHAQPLFTFVRAGFDVEVGEENMCESLDDALTRARMIVDAPAEPPPAIAEPEVARSRSP